MATKGLSIPVRVGKSGGAQKDTFSNQLIKIIKSALAAGGDDNPFQELGTQEELIFAVNDPGVRGVMRNRIKRILAKFNDRVALDPKTQIQFLTTNDPNEVRCLFRVVDLETDDPLDFDVALT